MFDPNGAGMLYNHPRWCPGCLHDWREKGEESYFPLYWYLSPVKFCPEHNNELVDKCLSCGRHQPFIPKHYHIDHCSYCGSWLGQKDEVAVQKPIFSPTRFDQFAADAVAEMIREGSDVLAYASYPRLQQRLKEYAELLTAGVCSEFERLVGFRHSVLSNWIKRDTRPKIQLLFLFCFRLETSPVRLLREDIPATIPQIIQPFPIHIARIQVKLTAKLRKQLHNDLKAIIDSTDEPITFMEACKKLGYTNSFLKYWFPDECRRITDQRKKYVIEKRDEIARQAEEFAYNTVMELLSQGKRANKKIIEKLLRPHKLSQARPAVRAGVKRAMEAFFAENSANG
ncbi:MAG: TniQ family protein [Gammaproteobacteria bacterium]|nr:TniQ family protein [Gammaproteobacteria bacterium]MBU1732075.1 TniQ family protein [Gammaproteobacteria bacterium]MBU1894116.1 TniQ family protein [Gammaproteobacteria bacterium]